MQFTALVSTLFASILSAQDAAKPAASATPPAEDVVQLSPFEVNTQKDYGYRASNSIGGTRTNTAIKDVPMNIQVFTKDIYDDLILQDQTALEAYTPSIVNGGADRNSDNVIQQQYQGMIFRGFRQNWFLRDGVREYDPVDGQNIARTEVVKGPSSVLYGLAYAGGVTQVTTKAVEMNRNFTTAGLTYGTRGDYRATLDANIVGNTKAGKVGIRVNGAYAKTKDQREHSEGKQQLEAVTTTWSPFPSTQIQTFVERGYKGLPNGLGYFSRPETGKGANNSDVPLQITHPEIPWTWNWSNGKNLRSLDTKLMRAQITQGFGEHFSVSAYYTYSSRVNKDGDGWDASGSGGADAWEYKNSGWVTDSESGAESIKSTYHYRDWSNDFHSYGATALYKVDVASVKNTFSFGYSSWAESELSREAYPKDPLASQQTYAVKAGIEIPIPNQVPPDVVQGTDGGWNGNGYQHESNSNNFLFVNWQTSSLDNRLKTNIGVNKTNIHMTHWNNGLTQNFSNDYRGDKVSPMAGITYDVTKSISLFAVHSTSLFPDSSKDSRGNQFAPFTGKSLEGGIKISTEDEKLSGTFSYYDIIQNGGTQTDSHATNATTDAWDAATPQERLTDPRFAGKTREQLLGDTVAGGEQEGKGFDIDVIYQPMRNWQIMASYAHNHHEFTKSAAANTIGQTYQYHQDERYSLLTKYTIIEGPAKDVFFGLGFSGGSKVLQGYVSWNGVDTPRYEPGRFTAELFAGYKFKVGTYRQTIQLNVKNLTSAPDYVGWKATGSATVLATERYKVSAPAVIRLTYSIEL